MGTHQSLAHRMATDLPPNMEDDKLSHMIETLSVFSLKVPEIAVSQANQDGHPASVFYQKLHRPTPSFLFFETGGKIVAISLGCRDSAVKAWLACGRHCGSLFVLCMPHCDRRNHVVNVC